MGAVSSLSKAGGQRVQSLVYFVLWLRMSEKNGSELWMNYILCLMYINHHWHKYIFIHLFVRYIPAWTKENSSLLPVQNIEIMSETIFVIIMWSSKQFSNLLCRICFWHPLSICAPSLCSALLCAVSVDGRRECRKRMPCSLSEPGM